VVCSGADILPNRYLSIGGSYKSVSAFVRRIHHLVIVVDLTCYKNLSFILILSSKVVMVMVVYRARRFCEQKKQQSRQRKSRRADDPATYTPSAVTKPPGIDSQTRTCSVYPESRRLALSAKEITVLERS
jgi:hypothetical protein